MKLKLISLLATIPLLAACGGASGNETPGSGAGEGSNWPENCDTVDVVVGFSAGGATDLTFRILADELKKEFNTDFQVLNLPGGGGITGINEVTTADGDGCTIGNSALPSHLVYLFPDSPAEYDKDDFSFAGAIGLGPQVIVVSGDSPYNSLDDLIAAGKAEGGLDAVSDGPRGGDAMINAQFAEKSGVDVQQVIVDGSAEKVSALLGGQVDFFSGGIGGALTAIESGQLKALAVTSEERATALPDVPTAKEQGIDVVTDSVFGVIMPKDTPDETREAVEDALKVVAEKESFIDAQANLGIVATFMTGDEYSQVWDETVAVVQSIDFDSLNK